MPMFISVVELDLSDSEKVPVSDVNRLAEQMMEWFAKRKCSIQEGVDLPVPCMLTMAQGPAGSAPLIQVRRDFDMLSVLKPWCARGYVAYVLTQLEAQINGTLDKESFAVHRQAYLNEARVISQAKNANDLDEMQRWLVDQYRKCGDTAAWDDVVRQLIGSRPASDVHPGEVLAAVVILKDGTLTEANVDGICQYDVDVCTAMQNGVKIPVYGWTIQPALIGVIDEHHIAGLFKEHFPDYADAAVYRYALVRKTNAATGETALVVKMIRRAR